MTAKQISVFLENKPGQLVELAKTLNQNNIDMRALSLADTKDFGIVRLIVDDPYKTACVLKEAGYISSITPVLAIEIPDEPGSLMQVLSLLGENGLNLEYTYAFTARKKDCAYMILRMADNDKAVEVLNKNGVRLICQSGLSALFED